MTTSRISSGLLSLLLLAGGALVLATPACSADDQFQSFGTGGGMGAGAHSGVGAGATTGAGATAGGGTGGGNVVDPIPATCDSLPAPVTDGQHGVSTQYWDCCKPHCSWTENTNNLAKVCTQSNQVTSAISGDQGKDSGCNVASGVYTCYDHAPWAACDDLAYGFAAVPLGGPDVCGKCYQLTFDGKNKQQLYDPQNGDPGSVALKGKNMIVMASNTGGDVGIGQFDIMIPGGGLGIYTNGCANQWGVNTSDESIVGKQFGGFRVACQEKFNYDKSKHPQVKECIRDMCDNLFKADPSRADLLRGCHFYVDWMEAADNPSFHYKEVPCPPALAERY